MNGADLQATGVAGAIGAILAALVMAARGGWEILRDARKTRSEGKVEDAAAQKSLHDAAQEGIMAFNAILKGDNERLRGELAAANERIDDLQDEVQTLRTQAIQQDATIAQQGATITDLSARLARLERPDGQ